MSQQLRQSRFLRSTISIAKFNVFILGYDHTIPDNFGAAAKIIPDGVSLHT